MKKPLPEFKTDEEAERFVSEADLTEYDLSDMRMVHFEFQPKSERVNMRLPKSLLDAVKAAAAGAGIPYQRFIRQVLESAVGQRRTSAVERSKAASAFAQRRGPGSRAELKAPRA